MPLSIIIWGIAFILYTIFLLWYIGFRKHLSHVEVNDYLHKFQKFEHNKERDLTNLRKFLENDTGKSFVMVNSLVLKNAPLKIEGVKEGETSREVLMNYAKPFTKLLIKQGGMPIFQGQVAGRSVDLINIDNASYWEISSINRFRSRRDFMKILINPKFHEKHTLKFASLDKSIAYPVDPWFQLGGFAIVVGLVIALIAALLHILLV